MSNQEKCISDYITEEELSKVKTVYLNYSNLEKLSSITSNLFNLELLSLQNNNIANFNFIKFLPNLWYFDIRNNPISSYDPLSAKNIFGFLGLHVNKYLEKSLLQIKRLMVGTIFVDLDVSYKKYFLSNNPNILFYNDQLVLEIDKHVKKDVNTSNKENSRSHNLSRTDTLLKEFSRKSTMNIQEKSFINSSISENLLIFYKFVSEYNQNLININIKDLNKFDLITSVNKSEKSEKNKNLIDTELKILLQIEKSKLIYLTFLTQNYLELKSNKEFILDVYSKTTLNNPMNYTEKFEHVKAKKIKSTYYFEINFLIINDLQLQIIICDIIGLFLLQIINKNFTYVLLKFICNKFKLFDSFDYFIKSLKNILDLRINILLGLYYNMVNNIKKLNSINKKQKERIIITNPNDKEKINNKEEENNNNINPEDDYINDSFNYDFYNSSKSIEEIKSEESENENSKENNNNLNETKEKEKSRRFYQTKKIIKYFELNNLALFTQELSELRSLLLSKNKFINSEERKNFIGENIVKNLDKNFYLFSEAIFLIQYLSDFINIYNFHDILLSEFTEDFKSFMEIKSIFISHLNKKSDLYINYTEKIISKHSQDSLGNKIYFDLKNKKLKEKLIEANDNMNIRKYLFENSNNKNAKAQKNVLDIFKESLVSENNNNKKADSNNNNNLKRYNEKININCSKEKEKKITPRHKLEDNNSYSNNNIFDAQQSVLNHKLNIREKIKEENKQFSLFEIQAEKKTLINQKHQIYSATKIEKNSRKIPALQNETKMNNRLEVENKFGKITNNIDQIRRNVNTKNLKEFNLLKKNEKKENKITEIFSENLYGSKKEFNKSHKNFFRNEIYSYKHKDENSFKNEINDNKKNIQNKINSEVSDFLKTFKMNFGNGSNNNNRIFTTNDSKKNSNNNLSKKYCKTSDNFYKAKNLYDNFEKFSMKNNKMKSGSRSGKFLNNNNENNEGTIESNNYNDTEEFRKSSNNFGLTMPLDSKEFKKENKTNVKIEFNNNIELSPKNINSNKKTKKSAFIKEDNGKKYNSTWRSFFSGTAKAGADSRKNKLESDIDENNLLNSYMNKKRVKITSIFQKREIIEPRHTKNTFLDFKHNLNKLTKRWNWNNPNASSGINIKANEFDKMINDNKNIISKTFITTNEIKQLFCIQKRDSERLNNLYSDLK